MSDTSERPNRDVLLTPPAYFRIAVVVGVATVLLGLSGLFWLKGRPDPPAFVRIRGATEVMAKLPGSSFAIEAKWEDGNGELIGEAGATGRDEGVWLFYAAPNATEVTLIVWHQTEAGREEVARGMHSLERGKLLEIPLER